MKKTYLAMAVAAASFVATPALAQDYQMEAGVSYTSISPDIGSSKSGFGIDFRYNFETVSTAGKPLAEAAFLGRNGGADIGYAVFDGTPDDTTAINIGADYWFEDVYVAATYVNFDDGTDKEGAIGLKAGYMIDDNLRVHVGFSNKGYVEGLGIGDENTISLGAKYVADLGGNFVNFEGEYINSSDYKSFAVSGDYFFTHEFSAGVGVTKTDISSADKAAIDIGAKYFIMPNVSGEVAYTLNNGGVDKDNAIGLRLAARF